MQTLVWRGVDAPRMEVAHVAPEGDRLRAQGTQIGAGYELRYQLEEPRLRLEVVGGRSLELELEVGRDHFDLEYAPLFNSLPVLRHGLHRGGEPRDFVMALVSVPSLEVESSEQRYEPFAPGLVRFRAGDFSAMLELDDDGFVMRYPGLAERVG
jgi:putative glycolipid-binding protein